MNYMLGLQLWICCYCARDDEHTHRVRKTRIFRNLSGQRVTTFDLSSPIDLLKTIIDFFFFFFTSLLVVPGNNDKFNKWYRADKS